MPTKTKEYDNKHKELCRVAFYTTPTIKKLIELDSLKDGSVSKVCNKIIKPHYNFVK
jgi:hypothetical protein